MVAQVFGNGPDITFVLATIHGNEPAGTALVRRLAQHLEQNPHLLARQRRVVLLPVANPDGMVMGTRHNANGVDLNRNFQTANRVNNAESGKTALSEPETRAIHAIIERYSPDRIVSIHASMGCVDYDGPAYLLAARMGQYCNLPIKTLGPKAGSLGSYGGVTLGIPTITLELPPGESDRDSETLWLRYGKALLAAITYPEKFD
jgi:protein MpaA